MLCIGSIKTARVCLSHMRCLKSQNAAWLSSVSICQQQTGVPTQPGSTRSTGSGSHTGTSTNVCATAQTVLQTRRLHGIHSKTLAYPILPDCTQKRYYMKKKTMKILPTKPLNFDYSGDLTTEIHPPDKKELKVEFEGVGNIENLDETVHKLLTVEFGDGHDKQKRLVYDVISKVREHPLDIRTQEVLIAYLTVALRNQMKHVLEFRKDKAAKSLLILRIQARRKHMKRLRRMDMDKFLWLCEELKIKYIPVPLYNRKESRRARLKREAREAAIAVKKEKMRLFQERLEQEKREFLAHKEKELADIEEKLQGLKLEPDSYLAKFYQAVKEAKPELIQEKPPQPMKRRYMILLRKFELAEKRIAERNKEM